MKKYNKLVRDRIPEIIRSNGNTPRYRVIESDAEYLQALLKKDIEESAELRDNPSLEELADKLEILNAIGKALGYNPHEIELARAKKAKENGGFDARIFLESTD